MKKNKNTKIRPGYKVENMNRKEQLKLLKITNREKIKRVKFLNKPHLDEPKIINNRDGKIIDLKNVQKLYTNGFVIKQALKDINISIKNGSFTVIFGKSGSGKTTLMNILSGLMRASNGFVVVDKSNLTTFKNSELVNFRRKNISFIFQQYGLVQTLNIFENVKSSALLNNSSISKEEILDTLSLVDIRPQYKSFPKQLSGGQQQRASIARALIKKPKILFCDEPTGSLDSNSTYKILKLFRKINLEQKTTIIIITHDSRVGMLADHLIEMEDGKIISDKIQNPIENFKDLFI